MIGNGQDYGILRGDSITHMMGDMPKASVDMLCSSPPFPSLYSYTSSESDIGNSEDLKAETKIHLGYFYRGLSRVLKPGRVAVIHVCQIVKMKRSGGDGGLFDFRGLNIRLGQRAGLIYEYDWIVRKNPQSQAIRTKSRELQFSGLESDRARSRGAQGDYLIKFRAPGENAVPVRSQGSVSRNEWIEWAECCWSDIRETDTLNVRDTKGEGDTRHVCPLQLGVIRRLIRLYSNPGELVFDPFTGIGSVGVGAIEHDRKFYGVELKQEYHTAALENIRKAVEKKKASSRTLFDGLPDPDTVRVGPEGDSIRCHNDDRIGEEHIPWGREIEEDDDGELVYRDKDGNVITPSIGGGAS